MSQPLPAPEPPRRYTVEEYFALEETSETRHEYIDGVILDMAGGSDAHAVISANTSGLLLALLRDTPCRPLGQELLVRYGKQQRFGYADCTVVCGPREYDSSDPRRRTLLNPRLIVEVLSPSTERFDGGEKFAFYREIVSFREYVVIAQHQPSVETFFKKDDGTWLFNSFSGLDAVVPLQSIGVSLPLAEVYRDVEFPPNMEGTIVPEQSIATRASER